jgi:hypothetical protein
MRRFLDDMLGAPEPRGIAELAPIRIANFLCIRYGGTHDAKNRLGPVPAVRDAFVGVQAHILCRLQTDPRIFFNSLRFKRRQNLPERGRHPQTPVYPQLVQKSQPSRRTSVRCAHSGQARPLSATAAPRAGASLQSTGAPRAG